MSTARRVRPTRVAGLVLLALVIGEILVIRLVAGWLGGGLTFLLLVATSLFGAWCIAHEGRRAWRALGEAVRAGRPPAREFADGVLVLLGGLLLLLPGFISDLFGLILVLPFTRPLVRGLVVPLLGRRLLVVGQGAMGPGVMGGGGMGRGGMGPTGTGRPPRSSGDGSTGPVIEGEIIDEDDTP
jgi:UPF0716 protein FxsA